MKTAEQLTGFRGVNRSTLIIVPAILGVLFGLVYIIAFPFIGLLVFISLSAYRAKQRLVSYYYPSMRK